MPQFVYTMKGLGKIHEPDHQVLRDIWLSFLPGAKIGVLGLNGAGKSTLLRIMAGLDTHFNGEAFPGEGVSVGFLPQEPQLDPTKDVRGNVEEGVAEIRALLDRYDAVNMKLGEEMSPEAMEKVLDEQSRLQDRIDATNAWDLDSRLEMAMDALRLPPPEATPATLSGGERRRVALCRLLLQSPDLLLLDEPTNHLDAESVAWLERFLQDYPGHGRRGDPRPLLPRQRRRLDPRARPRPLASRIRATTPAGSNRSRADSRSKRRPRASVSARCSASSIGSACRRGRARPRARPASTPTKSCSPRTPARSSTGSRSTSRRARASGDIVVEARGVKKAYGDNLLFDDLTFTLPRGGIVGVIGPNGAGKTTLFRMITGQEKPDAGTLRLGETVQIGYVDQNRDALDPNKSVFEEITGGEDELELGKRKVPSRAYVSWFNFKGGDQQRKVGSSRAASATASIWPSCCAGAATCSCSTSRPTTSTSTRCARSKTRCSNFAGLRRRHQPRPLVPRPHRHAHPGLRGRLAGRVVRGQLPGLRGRSEAPAGRGRRSAAPAQVPEAHADVVRNGGSRDSGSGFRGWRRG